MKQQDFERRYQAQWDRLQTLAKQVTKVFPKPLSTEEAEEFITLYRQTCNHLALARQRQYSRFLTEHLNQLSLLGHQCLYRQRIGFWSKLGRLFLYEFPQLIRQEWRFFWIATLALYLPAILFGLAVWMSPDVLYSFIDRETVVNFESMYEPSRKVIGFERDSADDFAMFGHYIKNNITVGFRTFAGGLLAGIGSLIILFFNGLLFGGLGAHMINIGYVETFYSFVCGHGSFELTAIAISGCAGLKLGWALISPGNLSRKAALMKASQVSIKLIYGVIGMLVIAAFIEAFWSSSTLFPAYTKYWVAVGLWTIVICYFLGVGRRSHGSE